MYSPAKVFSRSLVSFLILSGGLQAAEQEYQETWPREYTSTNGGHLVIYQPQIDSWEDFILLTARFAVSFTRPGEESPSLGSFVMQADTRADLDSRLVNFSNLRIVGSNFPSLTPEESEKLAGALGGVFPKQDLVVSLDRLFANLDRGEAQARSIDVKTDPPEIFVSQWDTILVLLDGKPIMSPIKGTGLQYAVNTNWDLFFHEGNATYFLRDGEFWLKAQELGGPWSPAGPLPDDFQQLPANDESWKAVRETLPGAAIKPESVPLVFLSEAPAEMILIDGSPELEGIPGTGISWITNTESDLFFFEADGKFYFLISGRWFRAEKLAGPWTFASGDLPDDFSRIPAEHLRGRVRPSVPGTPEADEAVLLAQMPQTATVDRDQVSAEVSYQGDADFQPIEGTDLYYAVNSPNDVIRVDDEYYLCYEGVWFVSLDPNGPWEAADYIPDEIYDIPPSSPVYRTTYVYVYESQPDYVVYGYTSGYMGMYHWNGCMVYGTGWYYNPYVYWGSYYPIYYPYHYSYGFSAYYNRYTGTYGRRAYAYGPYGGIGRGAAYNPRTGTYARGGAAWGPYNARGWSAAYNPRTGTHAKTRQGGNVYSHWGTAGVRRGDDWVRSARYTDSRGTVRGFQTSEGNKGIVARGGNNVYAGRDGNIYKKGEGGWQKYDNGNWSSVDRPENRASRDRQSRERTGSGNIRRKGNTYSNQQSSGRSQARDRTRDEPRRSYTPSTRVGNSSGGNWNQLDRDYRSRSQGASRQRNFNSYQRTGNHSYNRSGSGARPRTPPPRGRRR